MSTIMKSLYLRCRACRDACARSFVVSNSSTVSRWISSDDGSSMGFLQPRQLTDPASVLGPSLRMAMHEKSDYVQLLLRKSSREARPSGSPRRAVHAALRARYL